jgi:hypothetical protein
VAIPESQLDIWSHQGSITNSSNTYNAIKNVLEAGDTPYSARDYEVFLQGSYGNDTNIYAESDVDIVIRLNECWLTDLDDLSEDQKVAYKQWVVDAKYGLPDFKKDVLSVLKGKYANDVKDDGDKAIMIAANGNRRKADVIVAIQFRRYRSFVSSSNQQFTTGMCFRNKAKELIANYPKQHSANLTTKHQGTGNWLKPMIRILKNLRGKLIDDGLLKAGIAPSYYLEGLLYNVPSDKFTTSYQHCFINAMNWIQKEADKEKLLCVNEQYYLLRENSHVCWPPSNAGAYLNAAIKRWNNWG